MGIICVQMMMCFKCVWVMELLTLCCGARWISCCWSSSLSQLLRSDLHVHFPPLAPQRSPCQSSFSSSLPLVFSSFLGSWNMSRCVCRDPWILYAYLCSGGMLVCWLPAALVSCCLFSPLSRVVTAALIRSQSLFSFLRATLTPSAPMQQLGMPCPRALCS